jgi:serine/threonine-protein kinase RsbW
MPEENRFHLTIGSRYENIELVQVVLRDSLLRLGMDEDALHWVDISVREAVANAIKHGNRQASDKRVQVDFAESEGEVVIQIRDEGEGFDPEAVPNPLDPPNIDKTSGRGIFFMKKFMDGIEYGSGPDGGTVVTLRKRLASPPQGTAPEQEE